MTSELIPTPEILLALIGLQICLGAADTLLHHEFTERLAWQPHAKQELKLHALRNSIYAGLFLTLAWVLPFGLFAAVIIGFLVIEVLITLWDFVIEDITRKLPATERVMHTLMAVNYGAVLVMIIPVLINLAAHNTAMKFFPKGFYSWVFTVVAIALVVFAVRDFMAARRLAKLKRKPAKFLASALPRRHDIIITGATGFIGQRLTKALVEAGHNITVVTRHPEKAALIASPLQIITSLQQIKDDAPVDALINLAGEPIANGLWTTKKRLRILSSRQNMLNQIEKLCARLYVPPKTIINASAIGWYGDQGEAEPTETSKATPCFTHEVCETSEAAANRLQTKYCRVVNLRLGLVIGREGGLLANMLVPYDLGLGGPIGNGNQWMSWIELDDTIRLIIHAINTPELEGPVNAVAPNPIRNADFSKTLSQTLHRPNLFPVNQTLLTAALGDFARELFLVSQKVSANKVLQSGFVFNTPTLGAALAESISASTRAQPRFTNRSQQYDLSNQRAPR